MSAQPIPQCRMGRLQFVADTLAVPVRYTARAMLMGDAA